MPATGYGPYTAPAPARRSVSPLLVIAVGIAMLAIGAAIAAVALGVMNWRAAGSGSASRPENTAPSPPAAGAPTNAAPANANGAAPAPFPLPPTNSNEAAPPETDAHSPRPLNDAEEREVDAFLSDWIASSRAKDVDWQLSHYADVVDYYRAGPVPRLRVRADRARAYARFDTIDLRISNVREATVDPDAGTIRLVVDKEWHFTGPDGDSTGKVKQLIALRRISGELRIVAEKDLQVY
jgi:ketosteroid isomerase-like protein